MATAEDADEREDGRTDPTGTDGPEPAGSRTAGSAEGDRSDSAIDDDRYTRKKCALVTGCSSGIGRATAKRFLAEDWQVVATARNPDDIADLAEAGCETAALDVTDPDQVATLVEDTVDRAGALDCVVNNAGYAQMGPVEDVATADLHRQFDVNVYGPHRLTRAALPHMRAQGEGRIINVSSVLGRIAVAGSGPYSGSKYALEAMSDSLRTEVDEFGVDVVVIEPGPVDTGFVDRVDEELPEGSRTPAYESLYELYDEAGLVGGDGPFAVEPEEVASTILQASTCAEPAPRYPVGPVAKFGLYARYLPDWLRDAGYNLVRKLV